MQNYFSTIWPFGWAGLSHTDLYCYHQYIHHKYQLKFPHLPIPILRLSLLITTLLDFVNTKLCWYYTCNWGAPFSPLCWIKMWRIIGNVRKRETIMSLDNMHSLLLHLSFLKQWMYSILHLYHVFHQYYLFQFILYRDALKHKTSTRLSCVFFFANESYWLKLVCKYWHAECQQKSSIISLDVLVKQRGNK